MSLESIGGNSIVVVYRSATRCFSSQRLHGCTRFSPPLRIIAAGLMYLCAENGLSKGSGSSQSGDTASHHVPPLLLNSHPTYSHQPQLVTTTGNRSTGCSYAQSQRAGRHHYTWQSRHKSRDHLTTCQSTDGMLRASHASSMNLQAHCNTRPGALPDCEETGADGPESRGESAYMHARYTTGSQPLATRP